MVPLLPFSRRTQTQQTDDAAHKASSQDAAPDDQDRSRAAFQRERKEIAWEHRVILYPWITEKATRLAEQKVYVFAVAMDATKQDVARAIEKLYGVKPRKVTIIRRAPRKERVYRRRVSERHVRGYKKAMVHLREGDSITLV